MNRYQKAAAIWNAEQIKRAVDEYNASPNVCKYCGGVIPLNGVKPSKIRHKLFCNSSCAAKFNNKSHSRSQESKEKTRQKMISLSVKLKCTDCGSDFRTTLKENTVFLCRKCRHKLAQKTIIGDINYDTRYCGQCGAPFISKRDNQKFCSLSCSGKHSTNMQGRRSKNEIYFAELCAIYYENVLVNEPMFNGWDADVILPDLKIAILWNGNWHHKKITAKHSVPQVQNRDKIKMKEIITAGYSVYIIDDFGKFNKAFVESKFNEFKNTSRGRLESGTSGGS